MDEVLFLSDAWVEAADAALTSVAGADEMATAVVAYRVTGGPDGDCEHHLVLGADRPRMVRPGPDATSPTVTLTMPYDLAVAVNQGVESAQRAVLDGRIDLNGQPDVLLAHQAPLGAVDDLLAPLRARTRYAG
ncbi:MAG: hypothetical protein AAF467_06855 [Actinomycetota bacterium]